MAYRRLFIMRRDLHMSSGKLAAQVAHCAEAYWTHLIRSGVTNRQWMEDCSDITSTLHISGDIYDQYINGSFVKTICEAKSRSHLLKAKSIAQELGLVEDRDFGLIRDNCLTELEPEEEDGRTLTGIWFAPLPDDVAHRISKKYQLYKG